jgi:hypothetical protein
VARELPGERRGAAPLSYLLLPPRSPVSSTESSSPRKLRQRLSALLSALAQRLEPALIAALRQAEVAWDSFDSLSVLSPELSAEAQALSDAASSLEAAGDPGQRAAGLELRLSLAAALGLVDLCERRLATLVRLRVQSPEPTLLPAGRPFLDVAAALSEVARGLR